MPHRTVTLPHAYHAPSAKVADIHVAACIRLCQPQAGHIHAAAIIEVDHRSSGHQAGCKAGKSGRGGGIVSTVNRVGAEGGTAVLATAGQRCRQRIVSVGIPSPGLWEVPKRSRPLGMPPKAPACGARLVRQEGGWGGCAARRGMARHGQAWPCQKPRERTRRQPAGKLLPLW